MILYRLVLSVFLVFISGFHTRAQQQALFLDGSPEWVNIGDLDVAGDQLTVEALIHYTGTSVNIVSKHTNPGDVNYLLRIGSFEITTTSGFANFGGVAAAGVTLVAGRTYHVAATYNGQFLRYYVNGCLTGEMAWTGTMAQNNLMTSIGQQSSCQCEQFLGYIDEVRIWNVARTQAEIRANMLDLPNPTLQPGLLAYYKFNGNSINQQGNAAFNGTAVGATAFQPMPYAFPSDLSQTVSQSNPICNGDANGSINIQSSGAYAPYEYSIDGVNFSASPDFNNLGSGNYTVVSRPQNNSNCIVSETVTLVDPLVINSGLQFNPVSCFGATDGNASVNPSGGDGGLYHVLWSNGDTSSAVSGLAPGNYSVSITDSCARSGPELVVNGAFEMGSTGFTSDYVSCTNCYNGQNDIPAANFVVGTNATLHHGGFTGTGNGGGGNFMIVNGSNIPNSNVWCQTINVQPNTYYFFSTSVSSVVGVSPAQLQFEVNGTLLGPVFTAPPATGIWDTFSSVWYSGAATTASICILNQNTLMSGNDFGIDDISFTACISCTEDFPFTITEPAELQLNASGTDVSCNGLTDGTAQVLANGGTGAYSYSWNTSPAQNTAAITGLAPGTYDVNVSDANLCTATASVVVGIIADPQIVAVNDTDIDCSTPNGGSIDISATGNNLQYSVDGGVNFQTGALFTGLAPGVYDIVVQENNCQVFASATITTSGTLSITTSTTDVSCPGNNDGTASVNILSGNGNYTFSWDTNPVQNTQNITNLTQGTYTVTVNDGNACTAVATATIGLAADPQIDNTLVSDVLCFGQADGSIEILASGNNLQYSIDGGLTFQTTASFSGLTAGTYNLLVQENNCTVNGTATVNEPAALTLNIASTNASCNGFCDGSASATVGGGVPDYFYTWSGGVAGATDSQAAALCAGNYDLEVSDANGCTISQNYTIAEPAAIAVNTVDLVDETCLGDCNAAIQIDAANAVSYQVNNSGNTQSTGNFAGLCPGPVTVTMTDAFGCSVDETYTLNPGSQVSAGFTASQYIVSELNPFVSFTNTTQGATQYHWDFAAGDSSNEIHPQYSFTGYAPGIYSICLTAENQDGCTDSACTDIVVREDLLLYVPNSFTPNFDGKNDVFYPVCEACRNNDSYVFRIFNRWGHIVFESNDPLAGWDGTLSGGIRSETETYIWQIQFVLAGDVMVQSYTGHVNLLR